MTTEKKIVVADLTSVADKDTPTSAEDIVNIAMVVIDKFPNGIQIENLIEATTLILNKITELYYLSPDKKKDLIIDILCYVVDNTDAGALESMDPIIKKMIPSVIDAFIKIENGKLVVDKPKSIIKKVLFCCNTNTN
tara:strand:- start:434 stop:844 length:411 start_codon:yes stop_codon:yes gene_type:complete